MIFILIRVNLSSNVLNDFAVLLQTPSNPADINGFRNRTEKSVIPVGPIEAFKI